MLTIICGEDIVSSRNYFLSLKNEYKKKGYQVIEISPYQIDEIYKGFSQNLTLFQQKSVFFIENLYQKNLKKKKDGKNQIIKKLNSLKEEIFDWEDSLTQYDIKIKDDINIKEFKPPANIFKLIDNLYPGNLKKAYQILNQIINKDNQSLILYMIAKNIRYLIFIRKKFPLTIKNSWQEKKLYHLAKFWSEDKLIDFYDSLFRIDFLIKTSNTPFNIKKSLDILFCYFL